LATELAASGIDYTDYFTYFKIEILLTEKGYVEYERVCEVVGAYVKMLEKVGPQEWVYDEIKLLQELNFIYGNQVDG
jgi:secreted Zn-dependent insulinase-like peptidase